MTVGGCLKITTFRGTSMAKEAGYNEINTLSGEKGGKNLPNEKALVQIPTHETYMKKQTHCAQHVWTAGTSASVWHRRCVGNIMDVDDE